MSAAALARYDQTLTVLGRKSRRRRLVTPAGVDFTSNDYLGFAASARLRTATVEALGRGVPVGSGGSRLLRGNHPEHELLEKEAAHFFGAERALYFGSGYGANSALFSTLPQRGDAIFFDELVHASAREGIAASKAQAIAIPHNEAGAFEDAILAWREAGGKGCPWIAVESLYSMDGDTAPLPDIAALAQRHGGFLVVDEAHATGVCGPQGRGLAAELPRGAYLLTLHTCGKALGVSGALLGASAVICDYLVNRARGFIYATAPSPLMAAGVREALRMLGDAPDYRAKFDDLKAFANEHLRAILGVAGSETQILPVMIGDNRRALDIAGRMQEEGFDLRAIRPPTVPEGTARLRIAMTLNVDKPTTERMLMRLAAVMRQVR